MERRISEYFENETNSLLRRYKNIENLIPKVKPRLNAIDIDKGAYHTGEEGRFLEEIIKGFLNKHLPKSLKALTGFILRPASQIGEDDNRRQRDQKIDLHSPQLDIIVFDVDNYPVFETFSDFAIVPPEGVISILSIKKNLYQSDILPELESLLYSSSLCWHYNYNTQNPEYKKWEIVKGPVTALIAFGNRTESPDIGNYIKTKIQNLYNENTPADAMIKQISCIEEFTFFRGKERFRDEKYRTPFLKYDHSERLNFSLQLLLRSIMEVYYDKTRSILAVKPGYINFDKDINTSKDFQLEILTTKKKIDFEFMESQKDYLTTN